MRAPRVVKLRRVSITRKLRTGIHYERIQRYYVTLQFGPRKYKLAIADSTAQWLRARGKK